MATSGRRSTTDTPCPRARCDSSVHRSRRCAATERSARTRCMSTMHSRSPRPPPRSGRAVPGGRFGRRSRGPPAWTSRNTARSSS
jgi:hypothetical protein